ncbi:GntR family transcriptional regulator [Amycolatopsis jejuensis]|uniref:GntR family transcriptional regulator n=1 Tax=Amycolatopsis jejuensis TaxID=330084 RepID=UPI00068A6F0C|nr:GntR family transcriptional regulator [Amycolatopsis jejuensis]
MATSARGPAPKTTRAHTVDTIAESLTERINNGEFDAGSWIRQAEIAKEYDVSRTPVTVALSRLEAVGLVERLANRGFRIRVPSTRDIIEVHEVRGVLEGHAAGLAAARITEEQLGNLFESVEALRKIVTELRADEASPDSCRPRWHEAHTLFHRTVFAAAGNNRLVESAELLHHRLPRNISWLAMGGDPRLLTRNAQQHEEIAQAIDQGDSDRARTLAIAHMESARDLVLARFTGTGPDHP